MSSSKPRRRDAPADGAASAAGASPGDPPPRRNPGIAFDAALLHDVRVDTAQVARRAGGFGVSSDASKESEVAWLTKAVRLLDLTTLSADDTPERVRALCARAEQPLGPELREAVDEGRGALRVAAVCVYPRFVETAVQALAGSGIPTATVGGGFPHGLSPMAARVAEVEASLQAGAQEIDVVIARPLALAGDWQLLYDEMRTLRDACGDALMKSILGTGELQTLDNVSRAGLVCMMAGSDFIKTSTGKEGVNATLSAGVAMAQAIRSYRERTAHPVGLKPAGGIRSAPQAFSWLALAREELGEDWTRPDLFRIGASSLLDDLERRLSYWLTSA